MNKVICIEKLVLHNGRVIEVGEVLFVDTSKYPSTIVDARGRRILDRYSPYGKKHFKDVTTKTYDILSNL